MSIYSKRIQIQSNVLLDYQFDNTNYIAEDYKILTNLKEQTKSFLSLFLICLIRKSQSVSVNVRLYL